MGMLWAARKRFGDDRETLSRPDVKTVQHLNLERRYPGNRCRPQRANLLSYRLEKGSVWYLPRFWDHIRSGGCGDWRMLQATISRYRSTAFFVAAIAVAPCFWAVSGICPYCIATGTGGLNRPIASDHHGSASAGRVEAIEQICLGCQWASRVNGKLVIPRTDVTSPCAASRLPASPSTAEQHVHLARQVWRPSLRPRLRSAAQQRAFFCRFLL
jgi:hypothetical protein